MASNLDKRSDDCRRDISIVPGTLSGSRLSRFEFTFLTPCTSNLEMFDAQPNTYLLSKRRCDVVRTGLGTAVECQRVSNNGLNYFVSFQYENKLEKRESVVNDKLRSCLKRREEIIARLLSEKCITKKNQKTRKDQHVRFSFNDDDQANQEENNTFRR